MMKICIWKLWYVQFFDLLKQIICSIRRNVFFCRVKNDCNYVDYLIEILNYDRDYSNVDLYKIDCYFFFFMFICKVVERLIKYWKIRKKDVDVFYFYKREFGYIFFLFLIYICL